MLQNTNLPLLFLLYNIQDIEYYHFGGMLNNYYQKKNLICSMVLTMPRAVRSVLPLRKKLTVPYNSFKTKRDINIRSFFPEKYYSSQTLYVTFIFLSVKK